MGMEWNESLSTGIAWQDKQHQELFRRINGLLDAMTVGLGHEEVLRLFDFLDEYFVVHFEVEEQAMHRYDYPDVLAHLEVHTGFIDRIGRLNEEAHRHGVTPDLVRRVQEEVLDWLVNHIGSVDQKLAAFMKKADAEKRERAGGARGGGGA